MKNSPQTSLARRRRMARCAAARSAMGALILSVAALAFVSCRVPGPVPGPVPVPAPKQPGAFRFPILSASLRLGDSVVLKVEPDVPDGYQYRWMLRHGEGEWDWAAPWQDSPAYSLGPSKPGIYNVQVDIRRRGEEKPCVQKWLGTIYVGSPLIGKILYSPPATAVPAGAPIEFFAEPRRYQPIETLEFRLVESTSEGLRVIIDWRSWPLPPIPLPGDHAIVDLAMNVRVKDDPEVMQTIRLNAFYPHKQQLAGKSNLLRLLIGDDFDRLGREEALGALAEELNLALRLMAWEYDGTSAAGQDAALRALPCVKDAQDTKDDGGACWLALRLACGEVCEVNLERRLVREKDSPACLEASLKRFPEYRQVFDLMKGRGEEARMAAALTFAVYEGYHYGTPANYLLENVSDAVGHCGSLAVQLFQILKHQGFKPEYVNLSSKDGSVHIFTQAVLDDKTWILDPTTGYVYPFDARQLGLAPTPDPIVLPQVRNLDILNLKRYYKKDQFSVVVSGVVIPSVIPLKPIAPPSEAAPEKR